MDRYQELSSKMNEQLLKIQQNKISIWNEYVLFDWHWWFGVLLAIVTFAIWVIFHDKKATVNLLLAGLTTVILALFIDRIGHFYGWFDYQYDVLPMAPSYIPWDFILIPVLVMFTIQLFKNINVYFKGIVLSALVSFVGLPILRFMGIYKLMDWNYIYSFFSMFIIFVLSFQMSKLKNNVHSEKHIHER